MGTWHRICNFEKYKIKFKIILLVAELALCLPVSIAKLERSFSILKRIERDTRAARGVNRVENLIRISQEGPPLECSNPTNAENLWADHVAQLPAQSKRQSKQDNQSQILIIIVIIVSTWAQMMMMMSLKCEEHEDQTLSKKNCFSFSMLRFIF